MNADRVFENASALIHKLEAERDQLRAEVERLRNLQDEDPTCCEENTSLRQEVQVLTYEQGQLVMENERLEQRIEKKDAALDKIAEHVQLYGRSITPGYLVVIAREARSLS